MEGRDLWRVLRVSVSIGFSYCADLKEGKYSKGMKCADDTRWRNLVSTWQENSKTSNDLSRLELWVEKCLVQLNFGKV